MPGGAKAVIRETETDGIHLFPCPTPRDPPRLAPGRTREVNPRPGFGSTSLLAAREHFPPSACIMNVCHIRRLISVCRRHAETFAATPARLRYRFPMLAQLPFSSLPALSLSSLFLPLASAPPRLDGVKRAPPPTRAADFSF